jgi:hypothetical protein
MNTGFTDEQKLAWSEEKYRQQGFLTFACRFPKETGERLNVVDDWLLHLTWRVTGPSSLDELMEQLPEGLKPPNGMPYYYRAEVMD